MKKKGLRFICCLVSLVALSGATACDLVGEIIDSALGTISVPSLDFGDGDGDGNSSSYRNSWWNSSKNSSKNSSNSSSSVVRPNGSASASSGKNEEDFGDSSTSVAPSNPSDSSTSVAPSNPSGSDSNGTDEGDEVVELDFTPAAITEKYGYNKLGAEYEGGAMQSFYSDLFVTSCAFAEDSRTVSLENGGYRIGELNFGDYGLGSNQAIAVWATFRSDYPEFWWLKNEVSYTDKKLYLLIDPLYASGTTRASYGRKIREMAEDCLSYVSLQDSTSVAETVTVIYDYLIARMDYAYESDGVTPETEIWAYSMVGAAVKNKGVCESYAESFAWLCGLFGIESIYVRGYAGTNGSYGPHAWNLCNIGDEWITVDATWGDVEHEGENYCSREWLGKTNAQFSTSHAPTQPSNSYGVNYQVALPRASEQNFTPVLFNEENGTQVWCKSVDEAFGKIENEQGRYEITLYIDSSVTKAKRMKIYPKGAQFSTQPPKAQSILFIGKDLYVSATRYFSSELTFTGTLSLRGDLRLKELELKANAVQKNGYKITEI